MQLHRSANGMSMHSQMEMTERKRKWPTSRWHTDIRLRTFKTRQSMYVNRNTEERSCKLCCSGKAISITQSKSVFVALDIQQAKCMRHIVICGLSGSTNFFPHYLINGTIYGRKKKVTEYEMCVLILSTTFVWNISHSQKKWARYDQTRILVFMYSTRYSCQMFKKTWIFSIDFLKILKFHQNPSSGNRVVPCGRKDGQTDMAKLTVTFTVLRTQLKRFHDDWCTGHLLKTLYLHNTTRTTAHPVSLVNIC